MSMLNSAVSQHAEMSPLDDAKSPSPSVESELMVADMLDDDGAAVIIHSKADDYRSQPSGDAGDRTACGVLGCRGRSASPISWHR